MILIDTNALIVLLLGLMDTKLISTHKRTSIYKEQDFYDLLAVIKDIRNLVVLPNIWTEVDNLLNNFKGDYGYKYVTVISGVIRLSSEKFIASVNAVNSDSFPMLGLTDSLILHYSKECDLLVTSDSQLSDYAISYGIEVYDVVKNRNERFK